MRSEVYNSPGDTCTAVKGGNGDRGREDEVKGGLPNKWTILEPVPSAAQEPGQKERFGTHQRK